MPAQSNFRISISAHPSSWMVGKWWGHSVLLAFATELLGCLPGDLLSAPTERVHGYKKGSTEEEAEVEGILKYAANMAAGLDYMGIKPAGWSSSNGGDDRFQKEGMSMRGSKEGEEREKKQDEDCVMGERDITIVKREGGGEQRGDDQTNRKKMRRSDSTSSLLLNDVLKRSIDKDGDIAMLSSSSPYTVPRGFHSALDFLVQASSSLLSPLSTCYLPSSSSSTSSPSAATAAAATTAGKSGPWMEEYFAEHPLSSKPLQAEQDAVLKIVRRYQSLLQYIYTQQV